MNKLGLYIHIPFCRRKCAYCDFYSLSGAAEAAGPYIEKVCGQLKSLSALCVDRVCDTVYIGGGTPTILPTALIERLVGCIRENYAIPPDPEITIEANPATVTEESLMRFRAAGINRISFGVQTRNDDTLERIGRLHTFDEACASVELARKAGFDNVSADLMYALPGQRADEIARAYRALKDLGVKHFSLYGLKIEENTPFGKDKSLVLPDEDAQCALYLQSVENFEKDGYIQYEISNFALQGYESRHNLRYWTREEYLCFGPAAHSFFNGERFAIPRDFEGYLRCEDFSPDSPIYTDRRKIGAAEAREEELMLSLRLTRGYPLEALFERAHDRKKTERYLSDLERNLLAVRAEGRFSLTPRGMLLSNSIISDLLLQTE